MTQETENHDHHGSRWILAATCSALVLLVTAGGIFAMRDRLLADAREETAKQTFEREKLATRITALQTSVDALTAAPQADAATLAALSTTLEETGKTLEALNNRVAALEKKAEEKPAEIAAPAAATAVPAVPAVTTTPEPVIVGGAELTALRLAVVSGKPFASELTAWAKLHPDKENEIAPLTDIAEKGVISEAELARQLLDTIDRKPEAAPVDDISSIGKLNTHLKGLVSIKKSTRHDAYAQLRKDALREDAATLTRNVERLNDAQRAPLESWLALATKRRAALDALEKLAPATER